MDNFQNTKNEYRRYRAHISVAGTTQLHLLNPFIVAWWSAAFPGFGHLLLNKYLRGVLLIVWEVFVNLKSNLNSALVHSFCGNFQLVKETIEPRWVFMYIPLYIFGIWDSYRTTVDLNKLTLLAERENAPFNSFSIGPLEINALDKRSPAMAVFWSIFMPGTGQFYINRVLTAFSSIIWSIVFLYYSKVLLALHLLFLGKPEESTMVLDMEWLLFIPSLWGFSVYDSYINTVENNKLYKSEQRNFLIRSYQSPHFKIKKGELIV